MSLAKFELLPKELIAHIAAFAPASAVLRLSATCHSIRTACWDSLVFKRIITASQYDNWASDSLDLEAIASRADGDVTTFAQYAVADERAWNLVASGDTMQSPKMFVNYLPELFVVKHPFMNNETWRRASQYRLDQNPSQIFCLAMTILAHDQNMPHAIQSLHRDGVMYINERSSGSVSSYLWALCTIALTTRAGLRTRMAVWPYNNSARVPHIMIPTTSSIPLRPVNDKYNIPAPFSRRALDLLGKPTSSFSNFDSWYLFHNLEAFRSPTFLTEGAWCGYYIHFGAQLLASLNPPMLDIQFEFEGPQIGKFSHSNASENYVSRISAKGCRDGIDQFEVDGTFTLFDRAVKLAARKQYINEGFGCYWDLRLTPFGLVGFWGGAEDQNNMMRRRGIVWLWKQTWSEKD